MSPYHSHPDTIYEIQVKGELDHSWETYFDGLDISLSSTGEGAPITTLAGPLADQAALRGLLCKLWDLNLTLISLRRIETDGERK